MPWGRIDDRLAMSVKVRGLADPGATGLRAKKQRAEALGVWSQVLSWASGERSDGFVTADILDLFGWQQANERLLRARFDRAPLLHTREDGQDCDCMLGRAWPADYDYLIHDYLDRNPSRSENDVHRAKARELKDAKLKHAVRVRDQNLCRYCGKLCRHSDRRSDDGLTFDHVDPEVAAGPTNLVVACRGCNNAKRRRTPEQAGMALLPLPRSVSGSAPDLGPTTGQDSGPDLDPDSGPDPDPSRPDAGACPPTSDLNSGGTRIAGSPGTGRDGTGAAPRTTRPPNGRTIGPPNTPRGPLNGSPYLRPTRPLPEHHAGHPPPEYRWPPGSVPVTPPEDDR